MDLESLDINSLKQLREFVGGFDSIESMLSRINSRIAVLEESRKESLNVRFNMELFIKYKIFDPFEFKVIKANNINNLQELIDCNLDDLVGITPSVKEGLEWVRRAYDFSSWEDDHNKKR